MSPIQPAKDIKIRIIRAKQSLVKKMIAAAGRSAEECAKTARERLAHF